MLSYSRSIFLEKAYGENLRYIFFNDSTSMRTSEERFLLLDLSNIFFMFSTEQRIVMFTDLCVMFTDLCVMFTDLCNVH